VKVKKVNKFRHQLLRIPKKFQSACQPKCPVAEKEAQKINQRNFIPKKLN
jgi:hypothetical protein